MRPGGRSVSRLASRVPDDVDPLEEHIAKPAPRRAAHRHGAFEAAPAERRRHPELASGRLTATTPARRSTLRQDEIARVLGMERQRWTALQVQDDDVLAGDRRDADVTTVAPARGHGDRVRDGAPSGGRGSRGSSAA